MDALRTVAQLELPDAWIAAGFVRNAAWDALHGRVTPLNDIDVVYFDSHETTAARDLELETRLRTRRPGMPWSVKNQARMHRRHGHRAYRNTRDAMACWPEQQTAVAARVQADGNLDCVACFGFACLVNSRVDPNPNCPCAVFEQRVADKRWSERWPLLTVSSDTSHQQTR